MNSRTPLYTPIAADLPEIFRHSVSGAATPSSAPAVHPDGAGESVSWNQVYDYLSLLDGQLRAYLQQLLELPALLSPLASQMLPPGQAIDGDPLAIQMARDAILNRLASRLGCRFPDLDLWRMRQEDDLSERRMVLQQNQTILDRKSDFLRQLPSLWRHRHTPKGFVKCFCGFFGLDVRDPDQCPILLEHFTYRASTVVAQSTETSRLRSQPYAHQFMLLIPQRVPFCQYRNTREVARWIHQSAPAHLIARHLWVPTGYWPEFRDRVLPQTMDLNMIYHRLRHGIARFESMHWVDDDQASPPDRADDLNLGRTPGDGGDAWSGDSTFDR